MKREMIFAALLVFSSCSKKRSEQTATTGDSSSTELSFDSGYTEMSEEPAATEDDSPYGFSLNDIDGNWDFDTAKAGADFSISSGKESITFFDERGLIPCRIDSLNNLIASINGKDSSLFHVDQLFDATDSTAKMLCVTLPNGESIAYELTAEQSSN